MQIDGKRYLFDPVLSGSASPLKFTTRSYPGSDAYTDDIPAIDYLFLTHDHWDHLDHETILKLKPKPARSSRDWARAHTSCAGVLMKTASSNVTGMRRSGSKMVCGIYNTRQAFLWPGFQTATGIVDVFCAPDSFPETIYRRRFRL